MALFPLSGRKRPTCGHPKGEAGWLSIAGDPIAKSALYVNFQLSPVRSIVRLRGIVAPATSDSEGVTLRAEQANQHAVFWPRPHAAPAPSSALRAQHRPQRVEVNAARSGPPATGEGTEGLKAGRAGPRPSTAAASRQPGVERPDRRATNGAGAAGQCACAGRLGRPCSPAARPRSRPPDGAGHGAPTASGLEGRPQETRGSGCCAPCGFSASAPRSFASLGGCTGARLWLRKGRVRLRGGKGFRGPNAKARKTWQAAVG